MTRIGLCALAAAMLSGCVAPPPAPRGYAAAPSVYAPPPPSERAGDSMVRAVQYELRRLLYMKAPVSGVLDPPTTRAIRDFQRAHDLPVDGQPSPFLLDRLRETLSGY